jgi:hypothetical protein
VDVAEVGRRITGIDGKTYAVPPKTSKRWRKEVQQLQNLVGILNTQADWVPQITATLSNSMEAHNAVKTVDELALAGQRLARAITALKKEIASSSAGAPC